MILKFILAFVLSFSFASASISQNFEGPKEDIDQLLMNMKNFSKYYVNGDMDKIVDCYTEDGTIMPTGRDIMEGKDALTTYWTRGENVKPYYHKLTPLEIKVLGDIAYDYGYYEGATQSGDGPISTWKGKYVIIWNKVDGKWKIDIDIWNSIRPQPPHPITQNIQAAMDSLYAANPEAVGSIVSIEAPDKGISWSSAVGVVESGNSTPLHPQHPALIASNTKTYVAAAILRLVEMGKVELDQSIKELLTKKTCKQLDKADYSLKKITIRHLLSHTSGITDYVDKDYFQFVKDNPRHRWTQAEQIKRAATDRQPSSKPGKEFLYADINYVLLTEIITKQTNLPFSQSLKQLLKFDQLGMDHTWFQTIDETPEGTLPLAHQYAEKHNLHSYDLDPSWDLYGGGGLAATASDLAQFFQYLFEGKIIEDEAILNEMTNYVLPKDVSNYCLGLRKIDFHGYEAYYHGGYWGTDVMYLPELNTTIAGFTLKREYRDANSDLSKQIINLLKGIE